MTPRHPPKGPRLLETKGYAAVRRNASHKNSYIDLDSLGSLPEEVRTKLGGALPSWEKENPVVRIVPVRIIEQLSAEQVRE